MEDKNLQKGWCIALLGDLLDYEQPTKYIVENTDYSDKYETPVLTAGKSFLLGYTNETAGIFNNLPVIIFDDFTTAIKFVDFPFKVKSSAMKILVPTNVEVNIRYVHYFMETLRLNVDTHKRYWISVGALRSIPIAPLAEQHRIVSKIEELFSELDNGIETLKKAKQQLKIYRQAVLKYAFEGKLTNSDVKEGELPEGWVQSSLGKVTIEKSGLRRGPFGSAIKKEFFVPSGFKVYEQGHAINNDPYRGRYFINDAKFHELKNFEVLPGDLLVSCSGVTLGRIVEIPEDADQGVINQALLRIRLRKEVILNKYFIQHFRAEFFQRKIFEQSQGTAMPNLVGIKDFKEIDILLPPFQEQEQIVLEIESRLSICDKIEESIEQGLKQAEALRQSILKRAFEGKLVPQDVRDENASILLERIKAERAESQPQKKIKAKKNK